MARGRNRNRNRGRNNSHDNNRGRSQSSFRSNNDRGDTRKERRQYLENHPRIERLTQQGLDKSEIVRRLAGRGNADELTAYQLRAIGFNDPFIRNQLDSRLPWGRQGGGSRGGGNDRNRGGSGDSKGGGSQGAGGVGQGLAPEDYFQWLEEQQQALDLASKESAFKLFKKALEAWGIPVGADIEEIIHEAAMEGLTPDQIGLVIPDIQETQTWKNRFPGWNKRVQNGYNQLSVAEYLNLENAYHRIMQEAGLPAGFYDNPSDFGNWIANDVSPDEVRDRVGLAMDAVRKVDPTARDLLTKFYGVTAGDLAAYFLDQSRALPTLERQMKAANVASWAARNGLQIADASHYEDLVDKGVSEEVAAQGYGTVATFNKVFGQLAGIYGGSYTQQDAENDVFFNQNDKRRKLVAKERANWTGQSRGMTGQANRGTAY